MNIKEKIKSSSNFKKYHRKIKVYFANNFIDNSKHLPAAYDKVYHFHIRKSGGTSVNSAFWNLSDLNLKKISREPIMNSKGRTFVRTSKELIESANYFYANSHFPYWQIQLQPNTYTFTILRDPFERLVSLYKYYQWVGQVDIETGKRLDPSYDYLKKQTFLHNKSFKEFIDNLSNKYLFGELYFFSEKMNIKEAMENLNKLNMVFFKENFSEIINNLNKDLFLKLENPIKERSFSNVVYSISEKEKKYALDILQTEIQFYNKAKHIYFENIQ
jgi:hypothetical protein